MRLAITLLISCLSAAPAVAADERLDPYPDADTIQAMTDYSSCMARRNEGEVRELLDIDYRTHEYGEALKKLVGQRDGCLRRGKLRFNRVVFTGGLAETLLEKDLGRDTLAQRVAHDETKAPIAARDEAELVGLCTVRAAPAEVQRLLRSIPASGQEEEAISDVQPVLGGCVAADSQAKFNPVGLRALLAHAAYRISAHNAPTQFSGN